MIQTSLILEFLKTSNLAHSFIGNELLEIKDFSLLETMESNNIIWVKQMANIGNADISIPDILVVSSCEELKGIAKNLILCSDSKQVFFEILTHFFGEDNQQSFISKKSQVETEAIGDNVYIGHNTYVGKDVVIGENVKIMHSVSLEGKICIGNDTTIASGAVVGTDGYGYYKNDKGINNRVPHFGGVRIGNNVDIGANTCIDRGTLGDTVIGNDVKIDNLCHIAHNVVIEDNVSVIALSMIAGSVVLKKNSYIAPSASVRNQLVIGENSFVGLGAVVVKNVDDNVLVAGVPAKTIKKL